MSDQIANSREEAIALGYKFYRGKPCRVHTDNLVRYTGNGVCLSCRKEYTKKLNTRRTAARRAITSVPLHSNRIAAPTYIGSICKRNHDGVRYMINGMCVKCEALRLETIRNDPIKYEQYRESYRRSKERQKRKGKVRQTRRSKNRPLWVTPSMDQAYFNERNARRDLGIPSEIDHFYPRKGRGFSGLDVPWNLIVIDKEANARKGNKHPRDFYGEDFEKMAKLVADTYEEVLKEQTDAQYSIAA